MKYGTIKVIKPNRLMTVWDAFFNHVPTGDIRQDNGRYIPTHVKTSRGKMLCKDYGSGRELIREDKMLVKRIVLRPDEIVIVV